jgi:hypothetical protein
MMHHHVGLKIKKEIKMEYIIIYAKNIVKIIINVQEKFGYKIYIVKYI